jgi:hypothetical protein
VYLGYEGEYHVVSLVKPTERSHSIDVAFEQKGAVPITSFQAHDDRMYGIDWDRRSRHEIVTCSLGKDRPTPLHPAQPD